MTTREDIARIVTLEDALEWQKQTDQFLWAEEKLAQNDMGKKWVDALEFAYLEILNAD